MSSTAAAAATVLCLPYCPFLQPIDGNWSRKRGGPRTFALFPPTDSRAKRNLHRLKTIHRHLNGVPELDVESLQSRARQKVASVKVIARSRHWERSPTCM